MKEKNVLGGVYKKIDKAAEKIGKAKVKIVN